MNFESGLFSKSVSDDFFEDKYMEMISVLSAHQIAFWNYEINSGKFTFSDDYFKILGLEGVGIVFSDVSDFIRFVHPDDRNTYRASFEQVLCGTSDTNKLQVRGIGIHGEEVWLEDHFFLKKDRTGNPEKLITYTSNITVRHQQDEKILKLEEKNRRIVDVLPEFIFVFNRDFFITDVLKAQTIELLHPVGDLIGIDAHMVYSPEVCDLFIRNIEACLDDGKLKEIEYYLDMDAVRYYFQARIVPFEDDKVLALIHDIGERVRRTQELIDSRQRAEEADRMKSVFLSNMSHEIRTPLNAIVGFSEIIAMSDDNEEKVQYLDIIKKNSELLLQLVNDILDLSRIESGKSEIHIQSVEMREWMNEVEKVYRQKIGSEIEYNVLYPDDEIVIYTDRNRLTQVIFNFLSNALKNTRNGSVTLGVDKVQNGIEIYVKDTGCGISEDNLAKIFNRFEKLNDFVQGTGLGLAICHSLAERLNGHIEVSSEIGIGSKFSLYLPYSCNKEESHNSSQKQSEEQNKSLKNFQKTILVAEDVEANYLLVNAILKKGYKVIHAGDGEEAVKKFVSDKPDLVLMDIKMPVLDGIEATRRIRRVSIDVPIIAVTAHAFSAERDLAISAGCNFIISKPYSPSQLREAIETYI